MRRTPLAILLAMMLVAMLLLPAAASAANGRTAARPRTAAFLRGDVFDSVDDTWTTCPNLLGDSVHQLRSEPGDWLATTDQDWFKVSVSATGTPISVYGQRVSGQGGSYMDVFDSDEQGRCATESIAFGEEGDTNSGWHVLGGYPAGWWMSSTAKIYFEAPHPGTYYFRVRADYGQSSPGVERDAEFGPDDASYTYRLFAVVGDAHRIAGINRYATAVALTRQMWDGADDSWWWEGPWGPGVILVSGENPADGLAATSMSLRSGLPVLLTAKGSLPGDVADEIERLAWETFVDNDPFTVYICGSDAAVSQVVEDQVGDLERVGRIVRLAGKDRYATAAAIASMTIDTKLGVYHAYGMRPMEAADGRAFIINGYSWADGLSAGPVAAFADAPVLMTGQSQAPSATVEWLLDHDVTDIKVVGSASAVATSVIEQLEALSTAPTVTRVGGDDRFETALALAKLGVDQYGMDESVTLVSGETPWDALTGGQLSFMTYSPILLTKKDALNDTVGEFYEWAGGFHNASYVIGGDFAVQPQTYAALRNLWRNAVPVQPTER